MNYTYIIRSQRYRENLQNSSEHWEIENYIEVHESLNLGMNIRRKRNNVWIRGEKYTYQGIYLLLPLFYSIHHRYIADIKNTNTLKIDVFKIL